jgi:hypothetical protein
MFPPKIAKSMCRKGGMEAFISCGSKHASGASGENAYGNEFHFREDDDDR